VSSDGLRERNKAKRRDAILDAALDLLHTTPVAALSTQRIAERAEVSPATVYNLVGTRQELLAALIDRVLDGLVDTLAATDRPHDPVADAATIIEQSARAFIAEGDAFRRVVNAASDVAAPRAPMRFDPAQLQIAAMRAAQERNLLRADVDPDALGRQVFWSYNGALMAWANGVLSDEAFVAAALHGLAVVLAAAAAPRHRRRFDGELITAGERLASTAQR
jgi:AcrR family transcriptional regulator